MQSPNLEFKIMDVFIMMYVCICRGQLVKELYHLAVFLKHYLKAITSLVAACTKLKMYTQYEHLYIALY